MHLLLCAATSFEIQPVIDYIRKDKLDIEVLITGVGMTAATYSLTRTIAAKKPRFILQAGIAGSLSEHRPLTQVVLVGSEVIGDLGVDEQGRFKSLFDLGLLQADSFPWKKGKLTNNLDLLRKTGLTIVDGVTVNEISTSRERIAYYREHLGADVESMEGAALHYVALMENIPFLQIRSLSNFAGERDKSRWMMQAAIGALNLELQRIFLNLMKR